MGPAARGPLDLAALEGADATSGHVVLVAGGIAEPGTLPTQVRPQGTDVAVNLLRPCVWRPVDRATLEVVDTADAVRRSGLVRDRVAEEAAMPADPAVVDADGAVDLERAGLRGPVDRRVLVVPCPTAPITEIHLPAAGARVHRSPDPRDLPRLVVDRSHAAPPCCGRTSAVGCLRSSDALVD